MMQLLLQFYELKLIHKFSSELPSSTITVKCIWKMHSRSNMCGTVRTANWKLFHTFWWIPWQL